MNEKDPLRLLEAAYVFDGTEQAWLKGLVDALMAYDLGQGVAAYISELGAAPRIRAIENQTFKANAVIEKVAQMAPPALFNVLHAPMALTDSLGAYPRAAKLFGDVLQSLPPLPPNETVLRAAQLDPSEFDLPKMAYAMAGGDANIATTLIAFHALPGDAFSPADVHALDCFAAHLGSVFRLRDVVGAAAGTADHADVEAVIAPDGTILDKRGPKRDEDDAPLLDAIRKTENAKLRSASPSERLDLMTALVEGRWSIIESTERDGKRLLLACRNSPRTARFRSLTARERSVVSYAALGHPYKYIAYELGLSLSTVAADLKLALRKLGIASRGELMSLFATQRVPTEE